MMPSTYGLDLVFAEYTTSVDDHPGERATKVNDFMHNERHDPCSQDIVVHIGVPCLP